MNETLAAGMPGVGLLALLVSATLLGACGEAIDDFDSELTCGDYCAKKYDCNEQEPTNEESSACIGSCRDSIEDDCGNDNQGAANDKIGECVDLSCLEFGPCMVFEAAPECFGFVD